MAAAVAAFRASGIDRVPITHNDVYPSGHFATGLGEVDWWVLVPALPLAATGR